MAIVSAPGPVLLGFSLNTFAVPLLGLLLFPLQMHKDLQYGLLVACSVPCTLAAASVWTRKAGGNDAVSLLVTLTTSLVCFASTLFWLSLPQTLGLGSTSEAVAVLSPAHTIQDHLGSRHRCHLPDSAGASVASDPRQA
ncbi:MAG: bile acid:sodium symporter [Planctomycetales bacterium]